MLSRRWEQCQDGYITFRHTALSRMIEAGYDDYTVAAISGHSSTRMPARYTHPTEARKEEALESFSVVTNWSQRVGQEVPGERERDAEMAASVDLSRVGVGGPHVNHIPIVSYCCGASVA